MAGAGNPFATRPATPTAPTTPAAPFVPQAGPATMSPPVQIMQSAQPSVFNTSANLYNQAAAGPNIGQFMNPYTNMVTGNTLQSLERQRQMQMNDIGAQATRAGAFGGSRQGVAEALTNEAFARQGAETFGNLQQQGFNTALGAAQNQQGIQANLANLGFGFGQQIGAQQAEQGALVQALNQALINAARQQFGGFTGAPQAALNLPLQAVGAANMGQQTTNTTATGATNTTGTSTTQNRPGAFGILSGLLGI